MSSELTPISLRRGGVGTGALHFGGKAVDARSALASRLLGVISLAVIVGSSLFIVIAVADRPSGLSAISRPHFFPHWLAGPLGGLLPSLTRSNGKLEAIVSVLVLVMYVSYLIGIKHVPKLRARWVIGALLAVHVIYFLAPPLTLTDVFNYINYARMDVIHHLNPYATIPVLEPHHDPAFRLSNWHELLSPYGPLFTILAFAVTPFSIAVSFWLVKGALAIFSLASLALVWQCAKLLRRDPIQAVAFVGLNPIVLLWGLGGDHNDFVMMFFILLACWLLLLARRALAAPSQAVSGEPIAATAANGADAIAFGGQLSDGQAPTAAHNAPNAAHNAPNAAYSVPAGATSAPTAAPRAPATAHDLPAATSNGKAPSPAATPRALRVPPALLEALAGASLAAAVFVKASGGIVVPVIVVALLRTPRRALHTVLGGIVATALLGVLSYAVFGAHIPDIGTQGRIVTNMSLANLFGLAIGLGGETTQLRELFIVALVVAVLLCCISAWRGRDFITSAGWASLALLATLAWVLPWYVLWVLPLAALSRSRKLRTATILFGVYLILVSAPSAMGVWESIGFKPGQTKIGEIHHREVTELLN